MTPLCEEILSDYFASPWLKLALTSALDRDPVDACHDAELLRAVLAGEHDRAEVLADFAVRFWVKGQLRLALGLPATQALADAERLAAALKEWCDDVLGAAESVSDWLAEFQSSLQEV